MKRPSGPPVVDQSSKSMRMDDNSKPYCYKFLSPMALCASLMGPKGKIIQDIQTETGTFIKFTDRGNCYPGTNSRIGTVQGGSAEQLCTTLKTVIGHLVECSQNTTHAVDLTEVGTNGQLMFSMLIPKPMRGVIIGPAGAQVSELRKMSNTKIRLEDGLPSDSVVKIEGQAEGICAVALWINEKLGEAVSESYFSTWARGIHNSHGSHVMDLPPPPRQEPRPQMNTRIPQNALGAPRNEPRPREDTIERAPRVPTNVSDILLRVSRDVNHDTRVHAMQVPIPIEFKGALIGKGGSGVKEILYESLVSMLNISEVDGGTHCMVTIEGSVMACTAAYLLVMRRYVAHCRLRESQPPHSPGGPPYPDEFVMNPSA
eukprot:GEMP01023050.1.p1 GENE.GEMP01023050.1~~GEMP01023050.1.p1  ORF type:complete len:372 (+),score=63.35 GEMP01023050.1:47-1162(+)